MRAIYNKVPISQYLKFAQNGNAHTNALLISWTGNKNLKNWFLPLEFCSLYRAIPNTLKDITQKL